MTPERKEYVKSYQKEYRKTYVYKKTEGSCSSTHCSRPATEGYKTCEQCRKRNIQYKKDLRHLPKRYGICNSYPDCSRPTDNKHKQCETCRTRHRKYE